MQTSHPALCSFRTQWIWIVFALLVAFGLFAASPSLAASRSLTLHNTHTKETTTIVYKRNGKFDADGLRQLNRFLRDWRRNEITQMDPALFDLIWQVYKETGARKPIHVVSGYRSPATNGMLRSRSRGVAKNSRHTKGQALDFYLPGVSIEKIRHVGLKMQAGGVGYYPGSRSPFIHIDTGNVRHWPRMTRSQLARVFPNGKTVHVPRDGKPLAGYQVAKAQVAKRKAEMIRTSRSVRRFTQVARAAPSNTRPDSQQVASLTRPRQNEGTLLQSLLKRTPRERPEPDFQQATTVAPVELADNEDTTPGTSTMPVKLATLPKRPVNRTASQPIQLAEAAIEVEQAPAPEPLQLASLPRARHAGKLNQNLQLASLNPQEIEANHPSGSDETVGSIDNMALAALPKAHEASLEPSTTSSMTKSGENAGSTAGSTESATEILARMAEGPNTGNTDAPSNRFAYASSDNVFVAALPSKAPRKLAIGQTNRDSLRILPRSQDRKQLASLPDNPSGLQEPVAAGHGKLRDPLTRLTFAYGPSSMAHFAHIKQSTRTNTFARLSRPIPNRLSALMTKPDSMINQTFGHHPGQLLGDTHFAGPAVARMSVRIFN